MAAIKIPGVLPPDQVAKLAKKDLNEDPSRRDRDVKAIQEWLKKQPHLDGNVRSGRQSIHVKNVISDFTHQFYRNNR